MTKKSKRAAMELAASILDFLSVVIRLMTK
jgi:hypothetical protein